MGLIPADVIVGQKFRFDYYDESGHRGNSYILRSLTGDPAPIGRDLIETIETAVKENRDITSLVPVGFRLIRDCSGAMASANDIRHRATDED